MALPGVVVFPAMTAVVAVSSFVAAQPVIGVVAGLLTILSILFAALWAFHRAMSRIERVLGAELTSNNGSSMKDVIHRNDRSLRDLAYQINESTSTAIIAASTAQLAAAESADRAENAANRLGAILRLLEDRDQGPQA